MKNVIDVGDTRALVAALLILGGCGNGSIGGIGSGTGGGASTGTGGASPSGVEQLCVDTINHYRATLGPGVAPYQRWMDAELCADGQAQSDSETGTAHGAFGACTEWAQNECPGWSPPRESMITDCLKGMWDEGPGDFNAGHGHYVNMSSTKYTLVACGFYTTPDGKIWSVQDFK